MGQRWRWLACVYCFFGVIAAFGVGNATQINAMLSALQLPTGMQNRLLPGIAIALVVGLLLRGGAKRIGAAAEKLVPFAAGGYIFLCLCVLSLRFDRVGAAFSSILRGAFDPKAVTGGLLGSAFCALRVGCARGVFTNEAGMGTAAIAHGTAAVTHPAEQGMMGILEVFLDTILICTLTALVILCSGMEIPYGMDGGGTLTGAAFCLVCGEWAAVFLAGAVSCFAFATVLGWGLYGIRCAEFLLGAGAAKWFVILQMAASLMGAVLETGVIWILAEIVNGLMAIPNLVALAALAGEAARLTVDYLRRTSGVGSGFFGDNHSGFKQFV
jgi:AGCS family alanine or glycine:cation symporter